MNRGRFRRRLRRRARNEAKKEEAEAGGEEAGKMPKWFAKVAWAAPIFWCPRPAAAMQNYAALGRHP
jgi:hypothetical protein